MMMIIIIIPSTINCFLYSLRTGNIPWPWGLKGYFVLLDGEKSSFLVNVHRSQYVKQLIDVTESKDLS